MVLDQQTSPAHADFRLQQMLILSVPKQLNCLPLKPCHFQTLKSSTVLSFSVSSLTALRVKRTPFNLKEAQDYWNYKIWKEGELFWRKRPFESLILANFAEKLTSPFCIWGMRRQGTCRVQGTEDTQDTVSCSTDQDQQGVLLCSSFILLLW